MTDTAWDGLNESNRYAWDGLGASNEKIDTAWDGLHHIHIVVIPRPKNLKLSSIAQHNASQRLIAIIIGRAVAVQ